MVKMNESLWREIENFTPDEAWGDPLMMQSAIIFPLDRLRKYVVCKIIVHCGFEKRATGGLHPYGLAADCHIEGLSLLDLFLAASRVHGINGIGLHPWWNNPGIHADGRNRNQRYFDYARWISPVQGRYVELNADNIRRYCLDASISEMRPHL